MKSNEVFAHLKVGHGDTSAWSMDRRNKSKTSQLLVRPYQKSLAGITHLRFPCSARLIKHKMANRRKNPNLSAYEKAKQEPHPTWIYQFVAPPTVRLRILKYKIRGML